jgi:hypothetical protein
MQTFKIVLVTVVSLLILSGATFFAVGYFQPKPGGVRVEGSTPASVYINGSLVGKTPYKGTYKVGTITLKIVPDAGGADLFPFETKLSLTPGIETVVRREFGISEAESSGDIISFEKGTGKETSLIVVSTPDNAQVSVDGVPKGFAPYKTSTISPAEHQITVKAAGFTDRVMTVKIIAGFRLSVFAKLAKAPEALPTPTPTPVIKTYIEILPTSTGFLRVRTSPGVGGEEIAEVKPGEKYLYLETDSASGWYKIQYREAGPGLPNGITGWVSNQFTKKVESEAPSATPSASLNPSG